MFVSHDAGRLERGFLCEKLRGEAARRLAREPEMGIPPEMTRIVEVAEIWDRRSPRVGPGQDFRFYSAGGVLLAFRTALARRQ